MQSPGTSASAISNPREWTREFAQPFIRKSVAHTMDNAVPDFNARVATEPGAFLELLTVSSMLAEEAEQSLKRNVLRARLAGMPWEVIADAIGISAFAAQQRFGDTPGTAIQPHHAAPVGFVGPTDHPPVGTLAMTDPGLFAGQEVECLNRAGRYGWHAVDLQGNRWTLAFDNRQWQHIFTVDGMPPYGDGWQPMLSQKPKKKTYWSRPTNLPILPGNPPLKAFVSDRRVQHHLAKQR